MPAEHITRSFDSYSIVFAVVFKARVLVSPALCLVIIHLDPFRWMVVHDLWEALSFERVGFCRNYRLDRCELSVNLLYSVHGY